MARKKAAPAQIKIRLPATLRRELEREATKNGRTLNGEIVHRLMEPFEQADRQEIARTAAQEVLNATLQRLWENDEFAGWMWDRLRESPPPPHSGSLADRIKEQEWLKERNARLVREWQEQQSQKLAEKGK
jgi:hypothetical protein